MIEVTAMGFHLILMFAQVVSQPFTKIAFSSTP